MSESEKINRKIPMGCGMCYAIAHGDFSYKDIKKHPEKASHLCPMQAELGIGDGRP